MRPIPALVFAVSAFACVATTTVRADDDHERARAAVQRGDILPLDEIMRRIPLAPDERLLEVEIEREDGAWIYEIELLSASGRVREIEVDAADGRLIEDD
ncbi:MAG: PepSY domain-containing protein [Pseudomonadota bacterium]|jgi:uncharacterized membrane protein YkoI